MSVKTKKTSKSIKETSLLAKMFLEEIFKKQNKGKGALVVGLSGDLGAGKTTFTQAIARHLGVKGKISSPTFVIMKKYPLKQKRYKFLFHIDAYRLKDEKELLNLGWEEIAGKKEHLIFIEWPENVSKIISSNARFIYISHEENNIRNLELK